MHAILKESSRRRGARTRAPTPALLKGLIFGPTGAAMSPTHTRRSDRLYRYYLSQAGLKRGRDACPIGRVPAGEIEQAVIDQLRAIFRQTEVIVGTWRAARGHMEDITEAEARGMRRPELSRDGTTLTVRVPFVFRKRGGRKLVIAPEGAAWAAPRPRVDNTLLKALVRAYRWQRMLERGRFAYIAELAAAEKIDRSYLCYVLRLTLLAFDIVEAILDGRQPEGVTLPAVMTGLPVECERQSEWDSMMPQKMLDDRLQMRSHPTDFVLTRADP